MSNRERLSEADKIEITAMADATICVPFHVSQKFWLVAKWAIELNAFRPHLVTPSMFDQDESLILVSAYYTHKTYIPQGYDMEPEHKIVTGSIDPKSGLKRIVIDPDRLETPAAPIKSQIQWGQVLKFKMPLLDNVQGWSCGADDDVTAWLKERSLFRKETLSMSPKKEGLDFSLKYNSRTIPHPVIERICRDLHLRHPESGFDRLFTQQLYFKNEFGRAQGGNLVFELMRSSPTGVKVSLLRNLVETGQLDELPFKIRVTALLMSRGITTKEAASEIFLDQILGLTQISRTKLAPQRLDDEDFERFRWMYSENDFQRYRSVVESLIVQLLKGPPEVKSTPSSSQGIFMSNIWKRFEKTWSELTDRQQEAATLLKMGVTRTFKSVAKEIGISIDSLKDRWSLIQNRFRKEYTEFEGFRPPKTRTQSNKGSFTHMGLYWLKRAEHVHEVTWTRYHESGAEVIKTTPVPIELKKVDTPPDIQRWLDGFKAKAKIVAQLDEPDLPNDDDINWSETDNEPNETPELWKAFRTDSKTPIDLPGISLNDDDDLAEPN